MAVFVVVVGGGAQGSVGRGRGCGRGVARGDTRSPSKTVLNHGIHIGSVIKRLRSIA